MTKQEEILRKHCATSGQHVGEYEVDCYRSSIDAAMDEYAQQQAIAFFKWNARQASEYLDYLRRVDKADGICEKEIELDRFENATIQTRYDLFLQSLKQIDQK